MTATVHVPCNGCTACCRGELIELQGDDASSYRTMEVRVMGRDVIAIELTPEGNCVYLGEGGCTIHERAPVICRVFDCRRFAMNIGNRADRRRAAAQSEVVRAGLARKHTL